jgi:hypothetical protein
VAQHHVIALTSNVIALTSNQGEVALPWEQAAGSRPLFQEGLLKLFTTRVAKLATIILAANALVAGAAFASSESVVSPSGAFTVSVAYPDTVVVGTPATASESVTNNSTSSETLTLSNVLTNPNGSITKDSQVVTLAPGATFTRTVTKKFSRSEVGNYQLTFTVSSSTESASASASFTVAK